MGSLWYKLCTSQSGALILAGRLGMPLIRLVGHYSGLSQYCQSLEWLKWLTNMVASDDVIDHWRRGADCVSQFGRMKYAVCVPHYRPPLCTLCAYLIIAHLYLSCFCLSARFALFLVVVIIPEVPVICSDNPLIGNMCVNVYSRLTHTACTLVYFSF